MAIRTGTQAREESRHWLPSQGVDPAPLAELNAECLGLLAMRAAESDSPCPAAAIARRLRDQWAAHVRPRGAPAGGGTVHLFDAGFASAPRWLELRARGVHDQLHRGEPAYFERCCGALDHPSHAGLWLASGAQPAACGVPGVWRDHCRWSNRWPPVPWRRWKRPPTAMPMRCGRAGRSNSDSGASCSRPSSAGADRRLHELLLGGIQRLAADTLAAHAP